MKKILQDIPRAKIDCPGVMGAIFQSFLYNTIKDIPDGMMPCFNSHRKDGRGKGEPCTYCGNCQGKTLKEKAFDDIANEYGFISGEVFTQFDMTEGNKHWYTKISINEAITNDDTIDFMFDYAGIEKKSYDSSESKIDIFNNIVSSIDNDIPVILRYKPKHMYLLATGYDTENMALYGYDGEWNCSLMDPAPKSHEKGLFYTDNWYEAISRVLISGEKCNPKVSLTDVFKRNKKIMEPIIFKKYYDKAADYIMKDEMFTDLYNNLSVQAGLIGGFINYPIGGRSAISWYLFKQLEKCDERYREAFNQMASCCCDLHDVAWIAWSGIGVDQENSAEIISRLSDRVYRKMLSGVIRHMGTKDRHIYEALCMLCDL